MVDLIEVPENAQVVRSVQRTTHSAVAPDVLMPLLVEMDLASMFVRWLYTPGVVESVSNHGEWREIGAFRHLVLDNGGGMDEQIISREPDRLVTRLRGFEKSFGPAMLAADDTWQVEPDGEGSRVAWTWKFYQSSASPRAAVERKLWGFYMQFVLDAKLGQLAQVAARNQQLATA